MKRRVCLAALSLWLAAASSAAAQATATAPATAQTEAVRMMHASGTFDVKLTPQATADSATATSLSRMTIDKQYHGDLDGTGKGEMLAAYTAVKGSGVYVAIEHVSGTLNGKRGTFILQHGGTMTRGAPELKITVVPDSGTDELVGLAGMMNIIIADGKHSYEFEYTLAGAH